MFLGFPKVVLDSVEVCVNFSHFVEDVASCEAEGNCIPYDGYSEVCCKEIGNISDKNEVEDPVEKEIGNRA